MSVPPERYQAFRNWILAVAGPAGGYVADALNRLSKMPLMLYYCATTIL